MDYAQMLCHAGTDLGFIVKGKKNLNASTYILGNCATTTLWHQLGESSHMSVMVRYLHTFGHVVNNKLLFIMK